MILTSSYDYVYVILHKQYASYMRKFQFLEAVKRFQRYENNDTVSLTRYINE